MCDPLDLTGMLGMSSTKTADVVSLWRRGQKEGGYGRSCSLLSVHMPPAVHLGRAAPVQYRGEVWQKAEQRAGSLTHLCGNHLRLSGLQVEVCPVEVVARAGVPPRPHPFAKVTGHLLQR